MVKVLMAAVVACSCFLVVPTPACPPVQFSSQCYSSAASYQSAATVTYQAFPLTFLAVPTVTMQVAPPATREVVPAPQVLPPPVREEQAVVPQAAPITVQVPQAATIIQRQVVQSYVTSPVVVTAAAVNACGYGSSFGSSFGSQVIVNRGRSGRSSQVNIISDNSRVQRRSRTDIQVRERQGLFGRRSSTRVIVRQR